MRLVSPTKILLPEGVENHPQFTKLQKALSYTTQKDKFALAQWRKVKAQDDRWLASDGSGYRHWFVTKYGRQALDDKILDLEAAQHKTCLMQTDGLYWVYSGLATTVSKILGLTLSRHENLPSWRNVPWVQTPPAPRPYQTKAVDLLCPEDGSRTHGAVSIGTGLGKSLIMGLLVKRIGLRTVVVVPTLSIATQMVLNFTKWFGKGRVGRFFDGKKESQKDILIAVAASLLRVKEGDSHWEAIAHRDLVLCDESHTCPPDSLAGVMFGLLANIPYRYFFSGTQFRNDGLSVLLEGIVGDVVFEMSVAEGIDQGYLSPMKFFQWRVRSDAKLSCDDVIKMNKVHLQQNPNVYRHAAGLINRAVLEKGRRVLVLVDGVGQFKRLLNGGLTVEARFAHGGVTKDNRDEVPEAYWKSDPQELVAAFDRGEYPVLVGTSCIGVGTDIQSADFIVSIVGLSSEIEISQGIGRGTRLFPSKAGCIYNDYWVYNVDCTDRHAQKRRAIFDSIYGQCKVLEVK